MRNVGEPPGVIPPRPGSEIAFCQQKLSKKSFVFGALRFLGTVMSPSSFKKSVTWHLPQQIFNLNEWLLDNFPMIFGAKILSRDILSRDFGRTHPTQLAAHLQSRKIVPSTRAF